MKNINCVIGILILLSLSAFKATNNYEQVTGTWQGTLTTPGGNLVLIIKIKTDGNSISAAMDIPAQMARDIKASAAWFRDDSLFVGFENLRASYRGILRSHENKIEGDWSQNNVTFPLLLIRSDKKPDVVKHSQEPIRPYPYNEENIVFKNSKANVDLSGTFTWPKNRDNCSVAILISGSGPQDRNEEILGQKPFLVLADHLTKNGIAVLRYDDRGVGKSTGSFSEATSADFSTDVEAAIEYLKGRKEVNKTKIGLIGHSEGGMIAPMVASRSNDVSFVVLLAGPGIKGRELLLLQNAALAKAAGAPVEEVEKGRKLNARIYDLACSNLNNAQDSIINIMENNGMPEEQAKMQAHIITKPWFKYFLSFDPATTLSKVKCPVLALNGKKDLQVPYKENLEGIEKELKKAGNKKYTIKSYEGLNHLFQHSSTGLPSEYESIDETFDPEVLNDISNWILNLN